MYVLYIFRVRDGGEFVARGGGCARDDVVIITYIRNEFAEWLYIGKGDRDQGFVARWGLSICRVRMLWCAVMRGVICEKRERGSDSFFCYKVDWYLGGFRGALRVLRFYVMTRFSELRLILEAMNVEQLRVRSGWIVWRICHSNRSINKLCKFITRLIWILYFEPGFLFHVRRRHGRETERSTSTTYPARFYSAFFSIFTRAASTKKDKEDATVVYCCWQIRNYLY